MKELELARALERFIGDRSPGRVSDLRPLAGGASRKIYSFQLTLDGEPSPSRLVLRIDPGDGRMQHTERSEEFRVLEAARRARVSVPRVHWVGSKEDGLGAAFMVMDFVEGEALGRRLLRDDDYGEARKVLPEQLARELARIHAISLDDPGLAFLRRRAPEGGVALAEVERYRGLLALAGAGRPRPVLELAARWLELNAPEVAQPRLVHGDFRVGNFLFDAGGLKAVLDWELVHVGDAMEDLGWLAVRTWRYGADSAAVGGLCSRERFHELYARASGREVDAEAARYWELFGNFKWAVICIGQAASHRSGRRPDVELASLGRRVAEVEWELLGLLAQGG